MSEALALSFLAGAALAADAAACLPRYRGRWRITCGIQLHRWLNHTSLLAGGTLIASPYTDGRDLASARLRHLEDL